MEINLSGIGKKFGREWIFKNVSYSFSSQHNYVILGSNGSGKSTLLRIISGQLVSAEGELSFIDKSGQNIPEGQIFRHISYAAPYLDLNDEFTLEESVNFHRKFKPLSGNPTTGEVMDIIQLSPAANKYVKNFSSGMKQRLKLGLTILSDSPVLLLDEPCSNLDARSVQWYQELIGKYAGDKLIIVCSNNQREEFAFCDKEVNIEDYK